MLVLKLEEDCWTYMNEACGNDDPSAELFDDGKYDTRAVHLEHLLHNQGCIHSCSLLVLLFSPSTSLNPYQARLQTTSGR